MRLAACIPALAALASGLSSGAPATAAPNVPLCYALAQQFNQCQRRALWQNRNHGWSYGAGRGGAYDSFGGYDDDDDFGWRRRRAARAQRTQAQCAMVLVALQQNGCAN